MKVCHGVDKQQARPRSCVGGLTLEGDDSRPVPLKLKWKLLR